MRLFEHLLFSYFHRFGTVVRLHGINRNNVLCARVYTMYGSMVWNVNQIKYIRTYAACARERESGLMHAVAKRRSYDSRTWKLNKKNSIEKYKRIKTTCFTLWMRVIPLHLLRVFSLFLLFSICEITDLMTAEQQQQQQLNFKKMFSFPSSNVVSNSLASKSVWNVVRWLLAVWNETYNNNNKSVWLGA